MYKIRNKTTGKFLLGAPWWRSRSWKDGKMSFQPRWAKTSRGGKTWNQMAHLRATLKYIGIKELPEDWEIVEYSVVVTEKTDAGTE